MSAQTSDERIMEVIGKAIEWFDFDEAPAIASALSVEILAALRSEGYDLYRLELALDVTASNYGVVRNDGGHIAPGIYRLVPVSEGTEPQ